MFSSILVLILSSTLAVIPSTTAFRQPFDYLEALQSLGTIDPSSLLKDNGSSLFTDVVVGRIDVSAGSLVGRELNTEYLLGLFGDMASPNSTQLTGTPSSFIIQFAAIEPPVVAATIIMDIQSYDAVVRRWDEYLTHVIPKLAPKIAEELGQNPSNTPELITLKAATDVCQAATEFCSGSDGQYQSLDACMSFMTQIPFGQPWEAGMNTTLCRYIHRNMAKYDPKVFCPEIGPSGGNMCVTQGYVQTVLAMPFNNTLLAYNASFNAMDMKSIPPANVVELIKIQTETIGMTTVAFYPIPVVLNMFFLHVIAKTTEKALYRFSSQFYDMSFENQRNTVTYVMNTFITTAALILQLLSSPFLVEKYTFTGANLLKVAGLLISGLYIFELTYRPSMRWPLATHHFCTIFAQVLLLSVLEKTGHPALLAAGEIWLFQAMTEQSVFIGLFMYCMKYSLRWMREVLRFSAVQSFIFKLGFAAYLLVFWAQHLSRNDTFPEDIALSVILMTILMLLRYTVPGQCGVWQRSSTAASEFAVG